MSNKSRPEKHPEPKTMGCSMSNRPYVRYSVSADVTDKGIGYEIKKAVDTFLKSHGYQGHVVVKKATSDRFEGVIELFYSKGGKPDFNVIALTEHVFNSGRLPSTEAYRPDRIDIVPLPCDLQLSIVEESPDNEHWARTVSELNDQIRAQEQSLSHYNVLLGERQNALDQQALRIINLEDRVKESAPKIYDSPLQAVIDGWLANSSYAETLDDISEDYDKIVGTGNLDILLASDKIPTLVEYLNKIYSADFKTKEEFDAWKEEMSNTTKLEDREEYKTLVGKKNQFEANNALLAMAEKTGASPQIVESIKSNVESGKAEYQQIDNVIGEMKSRYESEKRKFESATNPETKYATLREVMERADARRKQNAEIALVAHLTSEKTRIFIPSITKEKALENYLHGVIGGRIFVDDYVLNEPNDGFYISLDSNVSGTVASERLLQRIPEFDSVVKALGVKIKIASLSEL
jgi:hypothetical protein